MAELLLSAEDKPHGELFFLCAKLIECIILITERDDGEGDETVTFPGCRRDAILVECNDAIKAVSHLKHNGGT